MDSHTCHLALVILAMLSHSVFAISCTVTETLYRNGTFFFFPLQLFLKLVGNVIFFDPAWLLPFTQKKCTRYITYDWMAKWFAAAKAPDAQRDDIPKLTSVVRQVAGLLPGPWKPESPTGKDLHETPGSLKTLCLDLQLM